MPWRATWAPSLLQRWHARYASAVGWRKWWSACSGRRCARAAGFQKGAVFREGGCPAWLCVGHAAGRAPAPPAQPARCLPVVPPRLPPRLDFLLPAPSTKEAGQLLGRYPEGSFHLGASGRHSEATVHLSSSTPFASIPVPLNECAGGGPAAWRRPRPGAGAGGGRDAHVFRAPVRPGHAAGAAQVAGKRAVQPGGAGGWYASILPRRGASWQLPAASHPQPVFSYITLPACRPVPCMQVPRLKAEAVQRVLQALADAYATGEWVGGPEGCRRCCRVSGPAGKRAPC